MIDIDPQCSLSLAVGFDPEQVSGTELTIYNLVKPSRWSTISKVKFPSYIFRVPDSLSPSGLYIIRGSFEVDNLDMDIATSIARDGTRRKDELFLYCKQMLNAFSEYDYVLIDCPPNKMFLTQAMLRASSFYLPVTIPDAISVYGMPRLTRWVKEIPEHERPTMLGYVLNAINRTGGGMVISQQSQEAQLERSIRGQLSPREAAVLGNQPLVGVIPRLDAIARFLAESTKISRYDFSKRTSGQPTIDACLRGVADTVVKRIEAYREA